jgi:hypothetical protein
VTEPATTQIKLSPEIVLLASILATSGGGVLVNRDVSSTLDEIRKDNKAIREEFAKDREQQAVQANENKVHFERIDAKVREHDDWIHAQRRPGGGR